MLVAKLTLVLLACVLVNARHPLGKLIEKYEKSASKTPFLEHVDYFSDSKGHFDRSSIATKWSNLTKEWYMKTYFKAYLTLEAGNMRAQTLSPGCPYRSKFESSKQLMPLLKHPADTGIVNLDGSINRWALESFMFDNFEHLIHTPFISLWCVRKSRMDSYLQKTAQRDANLPQTQQYYIFPWTTVAQAEWDDAFKYFGDCVTHDNEQAISADTFLQFYYHSRDLYATILREN